MGRGMISLVGADAWDNTGALQKIRLVCATSCRLYSIVVFNTGPDQYIQLFSATSAPLPNDVPLLQFKIPADSHGSIDFTAGRQFNAGLYVANSTTSGQYTAGAVDCLMDIAYRKGS